MFIVILKAIGAAVLGGLLLFAIPFLIFKAVLFFLFMGLIFRFIAGRRRHRRWRQYYARYDRSPDAFPGTPAREYLADPFPHNPQKF